MELKLSKPVTLVLGGVSSGKSHLAEALCVQTGLPRLYIATARSWDAEMDQKIADHIAMRGADWTTIEAPLDVGQALKQAKAGQVVLLDCATMWLTNLMMDKMDIDAATHTLCTALTRCPAQVVIVSNELGLGGVADNKMARQFQRMQGKLNQRLAALADTVVFVTAGLPQVLK